MKSFVCVFSLRFSLAAGQDMTVCSATASEGDYTVTFKTHNNSVFFTVSARTVQWVAIGVSEDTLMPDTDIVLGSTNGTDGFINDRYATARARPPVDTIEDITDTAVTLEDGFTTITFTRPRVSEDTTQDISLDQCRYFLWAFNGPVDNFTDPTTIGYHGLTNRGNFPNRYCIPDDCVIVCPALDSPVNGTVDDAEREYQSVATYSCDPGFTLDDTETRTCQSDGTWSEQPPTCIIVCPALDNPGNGTVDDDDGREFESVALYFCNSGFILEGASIRICQSDGTWTGQPPTCRELIPCPALDSPVNGTVDDTEREYLSEATYSCDPGFTLDGYEIRTCQSDGTWSGQPPTCVADTDGDGAPVAHSSVMLTSLLAVLSSGLAVFKF